MNLWPFILKAVCVTAAAMFWAVASVLLFRFGSSVFRNLNPNFWNPFFSSDNAKQIGGFKVDAYHISQGIALFFFFLAAVIPSELLFTNAWVDLVVKGAALSVIWIIVFPVTYGFLSPLHGKK